LLSIIEPVRQRFKQFALSQTRRGNRVQSSLFAQGREQRSRVIRQGESVQMADTEQGAKGLSQKSEVSLQKSHTLESSKCLRPTFLANAFLVAQLKFASCPHSLTPSLAATAVRLGPFYACRAIASERRRVTHPVAPFAEIANNSKRSDSWRPGLHLHRKLDGLKPSSWRRRQSSQLLRS